MTHPENVGNQFNEIMGQNFSSEESSKLRAQSAAGDIINRLGLPQTEQDITDFRNTTFGHRTQHFPRSMVTQDEQGELRIEHQSSNGFRHTWHGGPYIEHHHPKKGVVEVTNLQDHSKAEGENHYEQGLFTPQEFMHHVDNFNKYEAKDHL